MSDPIKNRAALEQIANAYVRAAMDEGMSPNEIQAQLEFAFETVATDWVQWADGIWRLDTVCARCGSQFAGICHEGLRPCTTEKPILRREYGARKGA